MTKQRKILWLRVVIFALCLAPFWAYAQQKAVSLRMDVDKLEVTVGDPVTLAIVFKQLGSGNSTVASNPQIHTPEHFEIRGQTSSTYVTIINKQTAMISETKLTLVATKPGEETLGPALLVYRDPSGKKKELQSNVATVKVVEKSGFSIFGGKKNGNPQQQNPQAPTPPPGPDELMGLKPLLPDTVNVLRIIFWSLAALLIAGFIWWQFRKSGKAAGPPAIPMSREAQLRDAWKKLGNDDLNPKEFCLGLSSLVRECVQYRYPFPAVNYTTEEILREIKARRAPEDERTAIEKCLKTCDKVLHADGNLTGRDNLRSLCSSLLPKTRKT